MSFKNYFSAGPLLGYFFRKKDPNRPKNLNIRMMHGVNKISIVMFLMAVLVMLYRAFLR